MQLPEAMWMLCSMGMQRAMLGFVVPLWLEVMLIVHGSCYHQGPDGLWSPRAGLLSETILVSVVTVATEAMLMSLSCTATKGYDGVHGLCYSRGFC